MGHPPAPLLVLVLVLHPVAPDSPCFPLGPDPPPELDLSNKTHQCSQLDWEPFQHQRRLWLSHNGIGTLSPSSRVGPGLEELDLSHNFLRDLPPAFLSQARQLRHLQLQHNLLRELPDGFFTNATSLETLRLEGNPLPAVPSTAFQPPLQLLLLQCRCDVVGTVLTPCSSPNRTQLRCCCLTPHRGLVNATEFHSRECQDKVGLVAGLAGGVLLVVLVVAGVVWYRRRKKNSGTGAPGVRVGWGKWEPAVVPGQSRYISRDTEGGTEEEEEEDASPDYENVLVSPPRAPGTPRGWTPGWTGERHSPPAPPDDGDYFLGTETPPGDHPIYANTQDLHGDNFYSH